MSTVMKWSLVLTVPLMACGGGGDGGTQPPPTAVFTSLSVSPATATLVDGDTVQLTATPRDQNNAPMSGLPAATFSVTQGTSVTVSTNGRVVAQSPGASTVTASLTSGGTTRTATSSANVTALGTAANVVASATGTTFSPDVVKIATGGQVTWSFPGTQHNVLWDGAVDPPGGDIGTHANGDTEARSFPTAGSYPYHCGIHGASMSGTVIVRVP